MLEPELRTHELASDICKFAGRAQARRSVFQDWLFARVANAMVGRDNHLTNLAPVANAASFRACPAMRKRRTRR